MKRLELNQMEDVSGGGGVECGLGVVSTIGGFIGIAFLFAFPPAAGLAALAGAAAGVTQGATMVGTILSCASD